MKVMDNQLEKEAEELIDTVMLWLKVKGYSKELIEEFLYQCGNRSKLRWEFNELRHQYELLARKQRDLRVKFNEEDKRYIRRIFSTKGENNIQKTMEILKKRNIRISLPTLYKICDTF